MILKKSRHKEAFSSTKRMYLLQWNCFSCIYFFTLQEQEHFYHFIVCNNNQFVKNIKKCITKKCITKRNENQPSEDFNLNFVVQLIETHAYSTAHKTYHFILVGNEQKYSKKINYINIEGGSGLEKWVKYFVNSGE